MPLRMRWMPCAPVAGRLGSLTAAALPPTSIRVTPHGRGPTYSIGLILMRGPTSLERPSNDPRWRSRQKEGPHRQGERVDRDVPRVTGHARVLLPDHECAGGNR